MSVIPYILIFGLFAALFASVIWGLWWAIHAGQFSDFQKGATSIFDDQEPVGRPTDTFPGAKP